MILFYSSKPLDPWEWSIWPSTLWTLGRFLGHTRSDYGTK